MKEVVFLSGADADLQQIYSELEERAAGEPFLVLVDRKLELLRQFPAIAPRYKVAPLRKFRIGRTPYGVFYSIESGRVMVIAIQDLRQAPETIARIIQQRL